jgi:hypothetical protein
MDEIEEAFRDGLRDAVSNRPAMAPLGLDEVLDRAARPVPGRRPIGRWVGLAAAVTLAAGLGLWAVQASTRVPTEPRVAGTPTEAGGQVRTLRVHNDTGVAYRNAALQLSNGRSLPLGDVPAGGTVVVPMEATTEPGPPVKVETSRLRYGLRVVYSGDCSSSAGQMVVVVGDAGGTTIQIVAPSGMSTADGWKGVNATIEPAYAPTPPASIVPEPTYPAPGDGATSVAPPGSAQNCLITIIDGRPTPEAPRS